MSRITKKVLDEQLFSFNNIFDLKGVQATIHYAYGGAKLVLSGPSSAREDVTGGYVPLKQCSEALGMVRRAMYVVI